MTKDIDSFWGSHADTLEAALRTVQPGSLVIEHGAGLYSSSVIARFDVRVLVIEEAPGWAEWSRWLYTLHGRDVSYLERAKSCIPRLAGAGLVFIDGAARERSDMLKWALDAGAPLVIAHDTERASRGVYAYPSHLFERRGYTITDDGRQFPCTTMWRKIEA
jgi:hypothetical protein